MTVHARRACAASRTRSRARRANLRRLLGLSLRALLSVDDDGGSALLAADLHDFADDLLVCDRVFGLTRLARNLHRGIVLNLRGTCVTSPFLRSIGGLAIGKGEQAKRGSEQASYRKYSGRGNSAPRKRATLHGLREVCRNGAVVSPRWFVRARQPQDLSGAGRGGQAGQRQFSRTSAVPSLPQNSTLPSKRPPQVGQIFPASRRATGRRWLAAGVEGVGDELVLVVRADLDAGVVAALACRADAAAGPGGAPVGAPRGTRRSRRSGRTCSPARTRADTRDRPFGPLPRPPSPPRPPPASRARRSRRAHASRRRAGPPSPSGVPRRPPPSPRTAPAPRARGAPPASSCVRPRGERSEAHREHTDNHEEDRASAPRPVLGQRVAPADLRRRDDDHRRRVVLPRGVQPRLLQQRVVAPRGGHLDGHVRALSRGGHEHVERPLGRVGGDGHPPARVDDERLRGAFVDRPGRGGPVAQPAASRTVARNE